jgi:hypothetical protein
MAEATLGTNKRSSDPVPVRATTKVDPAQKTAVRTWSDIATIMIYCIAISRIHLIYELYI